jgi:Mce-associated membrane protein
MTIPASVSGLMRRGIQQWQQVTCALLVAVALAVTVGALVIVYRVDQRRDRDAAIVSAAKEFTIAILNFRYTESGDIVTKTDSLTTGELAAQLADSHGALAATLRGSRVISGVSAVTSAIVSATTTHSIALVAAKSIVSNAHEDQAEQRVLRWQLTLERRGERWLVSNLEFVP